MRVRIVEIGRQDAFFSKANEWIGKCGTFDLRTPVEDGFESGFFLEDGKTRFYETCFLQVKVEECPDT